MNDKIIKNNKRDLRNARRRKRRLELHSGIDWVDPENGYGPVRGEQALWRAVILQMLEDATNNSKKTQDQFARTQARHWLEGNHRDFIMVCDLAGFDIAYARRKIKQALLNHCEWRKPPAIKQLQKKSSVQKATKNTKRISKNKLPAAQADILSFTSFLKKSA